MKMLLFALFIIFNCAFAVSKYEVKQKWANTDELTEVFNKKSIKMAKEDGAKVYGDISVVMDDIFEDLYFNGFVSTEAITYFREEIKGCVRKATNKDKCKDFDKKTDGTQTKALNTLPLGDDSVGTVKRRLKRVTKHALKMSKTISCAMPGTIANVRQCCQENQNDHKQFIKGKKDVEYTLNSSYYHKRPMTKSEQLAIGFNEIDKSCTAHKDCKTGHCSSGKCAAPLSCYKLKANGSECNSHPYCSYTSKGIKCARCASKADYTERLSCQSTNNCSSGDLIYQCLAINHGFSGVGECKASGLDSTDPSECCSNKVANGKCADESKCGVCKNRGDEPGADEVCCPGLIKGMNGKCVSAMPPFILDASVNILYKAVDLIQLIIGFQKVHASDLSREDTAKYFNVSKVNTKEKSDVNECEFNSFNDYWIEADPKLVNAMLTLQAFEVTYSGKGTNDYQTEVGKGSIFERSKKISTELRSMRSSMRKRFDQMDREMTCKCIHLLGPVNGFSFKNKNINITLEDGTKKNFSKKDYYTSSRCSGVIGSVDSGTLNGSGMENIDKIDSGAIGITHEKVLIEWLRMRRSMEADLAVDGQKIEESLYELSEFIDEYPWYGDDESSLVEHKLYSFRIRYLGSTWKWIITGIIVVVAVFLIIITFGGFAGVLGGIAGAVSSGLAAVGATAAAGTSAIVFGIASTIVLVVVVGAASFGIGAVFKTVSKNGKVTPRIIDRKVRLREERKKKGWKWKGKNFFEYDQYDRYLKFPHYTNVSSGGSSSNKTLCDINGSRFQCLKSAYLLPEVYLSMGALIIAKDYPIIDPQIPLTVPYSLYETEKYGPNKSNYLTLIEESFQNYLRELKLTYPRKKDGANRLVEDEKGGTYEVPNNNMQIPWAKKKYLDEPDPSTKAKVVMSYKPNSGANGWRVDNFGDSRVKAFKAGIEKYTRCKEMKPKEGASCLIAGQDQVEAGAIGFGYFFEDDQNIKDFVDYVYQLHFSWPNLSLNADIAYPKMGQDVYFQLIAAQMSRYNALAFENLGKLSNLINLYEQDLLSRISAYGALNSSATGTKSVQSKYSDKMWKKFTALNFTYSAKLSQVSAIVDKLSKSKGFSSGDTNFLSAISSQALRRTKQLAKRDNWNKEIGQTPRGKSILKGTNKFIQKFTSPLGDKGHSFAGSRINTSGGGKDLKITPSIEDNNASGFTQNLSSSGYNQEYGTSSNVSTGYNESLNNDLTVEQAKHLVQAAEKEDNSVRDDDSLFKVVSKAYRRNLDRVLITRVSLEDSSAVKKEEVIDDSEKAELKQMLESSN